MGVLILTVLPIAHAIRSYEFVRRGWWGEGPPAFVVRDYAASVLSVSSEACRGYGAQSVLPHQRNCRSSTYQGVHVYVSTVDDFDHVVAAMARRDPWSRDGDRTVVLRPRSMSELRHSIIELLHNAE